MNLKFIYETVKYCKNTRCQLKTRSSYQYTGVYITPLRPRKVPLLYLADFWGEGTPRAILWRYGNVVPLRPIKTVKIDYLNK